MAAAGVLSPAAVHASGALASSSVLRGVLLPEAQAGSAVRRVAGTLSRLSPGGKVHHGPTKGSLSWKAAEFVPSCSCRPRNISTAAASASSVPAAGEVGIGSLIAFQRDRDSQTSLALIQDRHGKRNWSALAARGNVVSLTPQQVVAVLPGGPYTQTDLIQISEQAAHSAQDAVLMQDAWECSEQGTTYGIEEMADLLFGSPVTPVSYAAAYLLLTADRTYFKQKKRLPPTYQPRTAAEVANMQQATLAAQQAAQERAAFVDALRNAMRGRGAEKLQRADWLSTPFADELQAIEQLAITAPGSASQARAAGSSTVSAAMAALQLNADPDSAVKLLKSIGWWSPHEQVQLLRAGISTDFDSRLQEAAEALAESPPEDPDAAFRIDMRDQPVFTIDDETTTEIDDGLGAERLADGRWKIWIHIADPSRYISPGEALDAEAARRNQSLYLPTGMIPMFPCQLAEGPFSLRTGSESCPAMSIGAVLGADGSVEDYTIAPTTIRPTTRMTYDNADAKLQRETPEDDAAFFAIAEAADLRRQWRQEQGAIEILTPETEIKVQFQGPAGQPQVTVQSQLPGSSPSRAIVAELMILAGQVIGKYGAAHGLPLPYRAQAAPILPTPEEMALLPDGVCRAIAIRNCMTRSMTTSRAGDGHAALGLPAYVQFTSPIRRYPDLLAHYQVKAHLRGDAPPLTAEQLDIILDIANDIGREAIHACRIVETYWLAHFFASQRQTTWPGQLVCWQRQETGTAKVVLDLGVEVMVRINRPAQVGERVHLVLASFDPAAGTYQLAERAVMPPPPPPSSPSMAAAHMLQFNPMASTRIPMYTYARG